eukprot:g57612.t1
MRLFGGSPNMSSRTLRSCDAFDPLSTSDLMPRESRTPISAPRNLMQAAMKDGSGNLNCVGLPIPPTVSRKIFEDQVAQVEIDRNPATFICSVLLAAFIDGRLQGCKVMSKVPCTHLECGRNQNFFKEEAKKHNLFSTTFPVKLTSLDKVAQVVPMSPNSFDKLVHNQQDAAYLSDTTKHRMRRSEPLLGKARHLTKEEGAREMEEEFQSNRKRKQVTKDHQHAMNKQPRKLARDRKLGLFKEWESESDLSSPCDF